MGAPIGDTDFEEAFYEAKATAVVSKIIETTEMLHDRSAAAAHTLLYTCLQHQWGYRMRTCRGDASIVSATARVDEALKRGLLSYSPHDVLNDELLARRARLPLRMNGLGIRSQADLLAPVWTGCFVQACEACIDRVTGSERWYCPGPSHSSDASSATARSTWAAHASNRSCPATPTTSRAHADCASTGRPRARVRRRRQAPRPLRVRSHRACTKQVSKHRCRRTRTTTRYPARAYSTRYAINSSSARRRCWTRR